MHAFDSIEDDSKDQLNRWKHGFLRYFRTLVKASNFKLSTLLVFWLFGTEFDVVIELSESNDPED